MNDVLIIIPTYNEIENIDKIITNISDIVNITRPSLGDSLYKEDEVQKSVKLSTNCTTTMSNGTRKDENVKF